MRPFLVLRHWDFALLTVLSALLLFSGCRPTQQPPPPLEKPGNAIVLVDTPRVSRPADEPKRLPANIVKAWTEAGAKEIWLRRDSLKLYPKTIYDETEALPGDLPGFRFFPWHYGVINELPDPGTEFGLDLTSTTLTDDGLKDLIGLTNLRTLILTQCNWINGSGFNVLARLGKLREINLWGAKGIS